MTAPVIIAHDAARAVCVLIHGRGQVPQDLYALVDLARGLPVTVVMPVAAGKSWYRARAVDPMTDQTAAELAMALDQVAEAVALAGGLPVLLAGFSQGACVAAEYLFARGNVAGACLFTGARVGGPGWPVRPLGAIPVYASGADADPWITLAAFQQLVGDLQNSGARVRADLFVGRPHEISAPEIAQFGAMLAALATGAPPLMGSA